MHASPRLHGDTGSSLMLMPAAVLIVLVLGAIAVDLSVVHLAQRDLLDVAASAANDAATFGIDPSAYRAGSGSAAFDPDRAELAVERSLRNHHLDTRVTIDGVRQGPAADEVTVDLHVTVDYIFAKAIPGARHSTVVHAHATATATTR